MAFPFSIGIDVLNAGVSGYLAVRLSQGMHQDPASRMLRNFFYTYTCLTVAYALLTVPRLLASNQTKLLGIVFGIGTAFFLLGAAFFARIVLNYTLSHWARPAFPIFLAASTAAFVWSLLAPAKPVVDVTTGITNWNVDPGVGLVTAVLFLLVLVPGAILFISRGIRTRGNHVVRVRSITIGLGSALLAVSAALVFSATTEVLAVVSDLCSIAAMLVIFLGVVYHRPKQLPPIGPLTPPTP